MFFFIEQLVAWFKRKEQAYDKKAQDWVKAGESKDGYNYRSIYDYRMRFGNGPAYNLKRNLKLVGMILLSAVFVGIIFLTTAAGVAEEQRLQKEAYNGHTCKAHELGDKVKVEYGVWKDATGTIVGGCGHEEDYQVKLDKQMYNVDNDGNNDPVDVGGKIIGVDTYRNLIKIEK